MVKRRYTKADVISEIESWINEICEAYKNSEINTNCLKYEWEKFKKGN